MPIDIRSLHYFNMMATMGSISKAAEALHIAQPALSFHLKMMESELNVKLMERAPRGVIPTAAGLKFLVHSRDILNQIQAAKEDVQGGLSEPVGAVSVGMPQSIGLALSPKLVPDVVERWPKLHLQVIEVTTGHMLEQLNRRSIDLGITFLKDKTTGLRYQSLINEELVLVSPPRFSKSFPHDTLQKAGKMRFKELEKLCFILPSPRHSLRRLIDQYSRQAHIKLNVIADVDSIPQLTSLVATGIGHTILSFPSVVNAFMQDKLSVARLTDPTVLRTVFLCRLDNVVASSNVTAIEARIVEIVDSLVRQGGWPGQTT